MIQLQFLNKLLDCQDPSLILVNNIDESFFSDYKAEYRFIKDHLDKYNNIPMIFDEAFVFCDDVRLTNILKTLSEMSEERQIIILSCSNREEKILELLNVEFNKIKLE